MQYHLVSGVYAPNLAIEINSMLKAFVENRSERFSEHKRRQAG